VRVAVSRDGSGAEGKYVSRVPAATTDTSDEFTRLATAVETPSESDRRLAEAWSRVAEMRDELTRQQELLAAERRRNELMRAELRHLRRGGLEVR
jgi:ABC-type Fe3+-citrate transport system substrate-binding protein